MLKSAGLTLLSKLLTALLNFAAIIIISRFLGPADKGICSWYLVIIATSLIFSELVAGPAVGLLIHKYNIAKVRSVGYIWSIFISLFIPAFFLITQKINVTEWALIVVLCWLNAANTLHLHLLLAKQRLALFNGYNFFLAATAVTFVFVLFEMGYAGRINYLFCLIVAWGLCFFAGLFLFSADKNKDLKNDSTSGLLKEGFTYGIANQAGHLTSLLNNKLVFFLLPGAILGVYSNALSLAEAILMIPGSVGQILYSKALNSNDQRKSDENARIAWWLNLVLLSLIFLILCLVPDIFYQYLFGTAFKGVRVYLIILALGMVFYSGFLILSYCQSAKGNFIRNFYATVIGLLANAGVCMLYFRMHKLDPTMGAICLSVGFFIIFLVSAVQFWKVSSAAKGLLSPPSIQEIQSFLVNK